MPEAPRSPSWHRDEIILALDLYVRRGCLAGGGLPGKADEEVMSLSEMMNRLPIWGADQRASNFRNADGVALKLANFRAVERAVALERSQPGADQLPKGMGSFSVLDRVVFEEFVDRFTDLSIEAEAIRRAAGASPATAEGRATYLATDAAIDGGGALDYEASIQARGHRRRAESQLVVSYGEYMSARGHEVTGRHYRAVGESRPLRADLMLRDMNVLVEAKASDARYALRTAIGQLLDYRRYEPQRPELAVLVPRRPSGDLPDLLEEDGVPWRGVGPCVCCQVRGAAGRDGRRSSSSRRAATDPAAM